MHKTIEEVFEIVAGPDKRALLFSRQLKDIETSFRLKNNSTFQEIVVVGKIIDLTKKLKKSTLWCIELEVKENEEIFIFKGTYCVFEQTGTLSKQLKLAA